MTIEYTSGPTVYNNCEVTISVTHPCGTGSYAGNSGSNACEHCPDGYECGAKYAAAVDATACAAGEFSYPGMEHC